MSSRASSSLTRGRRHHAQDQGVTRRRGGPPPPPSSPPARRASSLACIRSTQERRERVSPAAAVSSRSSRGVALSPRRPLLAPSPLNRTVRPPPFRSKIPTPSQRELCTTASHSREAQASQQSSDTRVTRRYARRRSARGLAILGFSGVKAGVKFIAAATTSGFTPRATTPRTHSRGGVRRSVERRQGSLINGDLARRTAASGTQSCDVTTSPAAEGRRHARYGFAFAAERVGVEPPDGRVLDQPREPQAGVRRGGRGTG